MSLAITSSATPMLTVDGEAAGTDDETATDVDLFHPDGALLRLVCEGFLPEPCRVDVAFDDAVGSPDSALDGLLHVAGAEPVCQALEHWMRAALDLVPADASPIAPPGPAPLRLRAAHRSSACPPLTLHLPAYALGLLPSVPANVAASIDLRFAPVPAICRVGRVDVPDEELSRLDVGGALFLPETFGGGWPVRLEAHGYSAGARLDTAESRVVLARGRLDTVELALDPDLIETPGFGETTPHDLAESDAAEDTDEDANTIDDAPDAPDAPVSRRVDIVLEAPVTFDPGSVLGGAGSTRVELPAPLARCRFHCLVEGRRRFSGHVAPLGDGHAFFALERSGEVPVPSAAEPTEASPWT